MKSLTKRLRLTQEEWESIQERMQEQGLTFSQYAISSMLGKKTPKKQKIYQANRELITELARWGNNFNQAVRQINTNKGLDKVGLEMLKRIEEHLRAIRDKNGC